MVRLRAVNKIFTIVRLPIANIARLVRIPTLDLERERLHELPKSLLRHFLLMDRHPKLADVSAFDGR